MRACERASVTLALNARGYDEQYVAVFAGGRATHGLPVVKGDDLYAFTLR